MRRLIALAALLGCASVQAPPGGPKDLVAPALLSRAPDSGAVAVRPAAVVLSFDDVLAERAGARTLEELVLISPRSGRPRVEWHRRSIEIRPSTGWKENTTYTITLRAGLTDLRNNRTARAYTTVFSTGPTLATSHIRGAVFDWVAPRAAIDALVEAIALPDSTVYVTATDSSGRFDLPNIPPGRYVVRGILDQNRNNALDRAEMWAIDTVVVADSQRVELLAFIHDSLPPRISDISIRDSLTLIVALDHAVDTSLTPSVRNFSVVRKDSSIVPLQQVRTLEQFERENPANKPPVVPGAPVNPIINAPGAARLPAQQALMPNKKIPIQRWVLLLAIPLEPGATYTVRSDSLRSLTGIVGNSEKPTPQVPPRPAAPPPPPPSRQSAMRRP